MILLYTIIFYRVLSYFLFIIVYRFIYHLHKHFQLIFPAIIEFNCYLSLCFIPYSFRIYIHLIAFAFFIYIFQLIYHVFSPFFIQIFIITFFLIKHIYFLITRQNYHIFNFIVPHIFQVLTTFIFVMAPYSIIFHQFMCFSKIFNLFYFIFFTLFFKYYYLLAL